MNNLHWNTVAPILKNVLQDIINEPLFLPFRLVGDTALSLQLGHRKTRSWQKAKNPQWN